MGIYNIEQMSVKELKAHIKYQKEKLELVIDHVNNPPEGEAGLFDSGSIERITQSIVDAEAELGLRIRK